MEPESRPAYPLGPQLEGCPEPRVTVSPAIGAHWLGTEVGMEALSEHERAHVQVPEAYALVRCWAPGGAAVAKGAVYLVLRRFLTQH